MFRTPLQRAIARGMKEGGDLAEELRTLGDYPIRLRKDAKAICEALSKLPLKPADGIPLSSPLHALTGLFCDVESADDPAFKVLYYEGLAQLIRIFDALIQRADDDDADDLLFVLTILAMYGSREGAERIVAAARRPFKPDDYQWHRIMAELSEGHPHRDDVFAALSDPVPPAFLGVSLLDSANKAAVEDELPRHPFDSASGWRRLQGWLEDRDEEHFSYARSAANALPFISNPARDQLLALAMDHIDPGVQIVAAWAAAKLGREAGLKMLTRYCLDLNHAESARHYLGQLDREDVIPAEANDPSFQAKAEFAAWLAHPCELGEPPDELDIVDHRQLAWPPEREPLPLWLIRFRLRDRTGLGEDHVDCGLVGSMTWCFFTKKMHERPPEDAYAIHCYSEMQHAKLIDEAEVVDPSPYMEMLDEWRGGVLQKPKIRYVAKLTPELKYPAERVAIAAATVDGSEGWAVLDGPRSAWYPRAEQPKGTYESVVLMIHVGRQLLGFHDQPDRKKYLIGDPPRRAPQQVVENYENLLAEAGVADPKRQHELLGSSSVLSRHFGTYVDALVAIHGMARTNAVIDVYDRFLKLAETADPSIREDVYGGSSVLGNCFDEYADALVSRGRSAEVAGLIALFAPRWGNDAIYLGVAAFKAGLSDVAEPNFVQLRNKDDDCYYRSETMSLLAEIWRNRGDGDRARELLLECMRRLLSEIKESEYNSTRDTFAGEFQHHRSTYLRLFPNGETELTEAGIPADPR